jgi:hypothetical protein
MFTESPRFQALVRTQQIITGAIISGLVAFSVIVLTMPTPAGQGVDGERGPIVSYVAAAVGVMNLALAFVVPALVLHGGLRRMAAGVSASPDSLGDEAAALLNLRQTAHIVTLGLLEGAGFLGCIAYLLEGHAVGMTIAGVMVGLMLALFPTVGRVRAWLEKHEQRLIEMRKERRAD